MNKEEKIEKEKECEKETKEKRHSFSAKIYFKHYWENQVKFDFNVSHARESAWNQYSPATSLNNHIGDRKAGLRSNVPERLSWRIWEVDCSLWRSEKKEPPFDPNRSAAHFFSWGHLDSFKHVWQIPWQTNAEYSNRPRNGRRFETWKNRRRIRSWQHGSLQRCLPSSLKRPPPIRGRKWPRTVLLSRPEQQLSKPIARSPDRGRFSQLRASTNRDHRSAAASFSRSRHYCSDDKLILTGSPVHYFPRDSDRDWGEEAQTEKDDFEGKHQESTDSKQNAFPPSWRDPSEKKRPNLLLWARVSVLPT